MAEQSDPSLARATQCRGLDWHWCLFWDIEAFLLGSGRLHQKMHESRASEQSVSGLNRGATELPPTRTESTKPSRRRRLNACFGSETGASCARMGP